MLCRSEVIAQASGFDPAYGASFIISKTLTCLFECDR